MCPYAISAQQQPQLLLQTVKSCPYSTASSYNMQEQPAAIPGASHVQEDLANSGPGLGLQQQVTAEFKMTTHACPYSTMTVDVEASSGSTGCSSMTSSGDHISSEQLDADTTGSSSSSSSSSADSSTRDQTYVTSTYQHWQVKRPTLDHDPKLTRRQLRRLGRTWTLSDVAKHKYCDDGWIAVDGKVYDITEHLVNHPGWDSGCQVTTVLSIIAHLGSECSEEFRDIHRSYPVAWKQLQAFYIGDLA